MGFYSDQFHQLNGELYPKEYLTRQLIQARHFMEVHFADNMSLAGFAREACLSKFHFIRLFKTYYGYTPHQHLISVRIREARKLLSANQPVATVCAQCGFESIPSFTALFKRSTGLTPAAFREQAQKSNNR
ncbi:helix-turn-helix domain-containing protein [Chitinophaga sp. 22321]|uniref:Helix-turn-helix transcriptional regulator n=1 Tax=Chitinophaga hostae TaxID=2831022 RepID=A0ABS5J985_9BACT|nr:AraC family transcriptional regulator [Chitinophaga hostae]MBS0030987.1 helix-turn-helix transcriptional regulator [Chitinophaga hostae]